MSLDGRRDKRIPLEVPISLQCIGASDSPEEAVTQNVSVHGARLMTRQRWDPREHVQVYARASKYVFRVRVVYCQPHGKESFFVGLELRKGFAGWWEGPAAAGPGTVLGWVSGAQP